GHLHQKKVILSFKIISMQNVVNKLDLTSRCSCCRGLPLDSVSEEVASFLTHVCRSVLHPGTGIFDLVSAWRMATLEVLVEPGNGRNCSNGNAAGCEHPCDGEEKEEAHGDEHWAEEDEEGDQQDQSNGSDSDREAREEEKNAACDCKDGQEAENLATRGLVLLELVEDAMGMLVGMAA
ncbi:hypothetical protein GOP47_0015131, partial [Adiantum capillus-veneris]